MVNHRQEKKKARSALFRETLADLLTKNQKPEEAFRRFLWYALRILVMELLEAEVKDHLRAERYERSAARRGRRNGYRTRTIQTAEGPIDVDVPRIRESDEPFRSMILDLLPARSEALVRWLLEGYARGLSTRDLEAILADDAGRPMLSRSAISAITERLWAEYEAFLSSDLSGYEVEYLWLDGVYESVRPYVRGREAVFCAWGMGRDGSMVLLGLSLGVKESRAAWTEFLYDLIRRGLREPVLVVTDGSPALIASVEACFPRSYRGRCIAHKMRNGLDKVPLDHRDTIHAWLKAIYHAPTDEEGQRLARQFMESYESQFPKAIRSFREDLEASLAHLRFPARHRKTIKTTNRIERVFAEQKRRTKITRFFDEKAALKLIFAAVVRATRYWRGFRITEMEIKQLEALRKEKDLSLQPSLDYELARKLYSKVA